MNVLKIINLLPFPSGGTLDYKGLDIGQFEPGSQFYADDLSFCLVKTQQLDVPQHADISIISEQQYEDEIAAIIAARPKPLDQVVAEQEQRMQLMQAALDDLILGGGAI